MTSEISKVASKFSRIIKQAESQKELWNVADQVWDILPSGFDWGKLPVRSIMKVFADNVWKVYRKIAPYQWENVHPTDVPVATTTPVPRSIAPQSKPSAKYSFEVFEAQRILNGDKLDYSPKLVEDGLLGPATKQALAWYRKRFVKTQLSDTDTIKDIIENAQTAEQPAATPLSTSVPQSTWGNQSAAALVRRFDRIVKAQTTEEPAVKFQATHPETTEEPAVKFEAAHPIKALWNVASQKWAVLPADYKWSQAPIGSILKIAESNKLSYYKKVAIDRWTTMNPADVPQESVG